MRKETILIIDDMSENVDVLVELLNQYDIITALDANTALDIINDEKETLNLILLDIMMPEIDGFELCKILKQNPATAKIPIIFLSAKNDTQSIIKGFELGGVDYVTKPFCPQELLSRVQTHLKLRSYEKELEERVHREVEKNKIQEQIVYQNVKQAALGELLMHIAHQWKQPLATLGSLLLLQRTKLEYEQTISKESLLDVCKKSDALIAFMGTTVDTFKEFYQPSAEQEFFLLSNAVSKVLNIVNATLQYNNIKIYFNSEEVQETDANENEFTQVLLSIINNAQNIFKIRDIKEAKIYINVFDGRVVIEDNGGGIDEKILDTIFRAHTGTYKSSGLGLYIAKEIIDKNGGIISAENTKEGARFIIDFLQWEN